MDPVYTAVNQKPIFYKFQSKYLKPISAKYLIHLLCNQIFRHWGWLTENDHLKNNIAIVLLQWICDLWEPWYVKTKLNCVLHWPLYLIHFFNVSSFAVLETTQSNMWSVQIKHCYLDQSFNLIFSTLIIFCKFNRKTFLCIPFIT